MAAESELISQYGYVAVLVGSMIEGDAIAMLGGIAARHGYLEFLATVLMAALGGMAADQLLYFLGRRYGEAILHRFRRHQAKIDRMRELVHRHASLWVIGVRFAYGFRIIGPLILGSSGIPPRRFVILNIIGGALWGTVMVTLGYCVGEFLHRFVAGHKSLELWLLIVAVWVISITLVVRRLLRPRP
ncbi:DedA family protein [Pseudomonas sp. HR96]|uniref:DedA family protein n=1 Tax=Pseudomonas sp. HR96 TaxID=1027966 RepID=UPI002A759F4C|nr:DedA family protein [Pseudomonas sp. HR96]WPO97759.1 DedA family protein [Pseudomonas sp. HR96]